MTTVIGRFCFRHRWLVVAIWLIIAAGGVASAGAVFGKLGDTNSLAGTESGAGRDLLNAAAADGGKVIGLWENIDPAAQVAEITRVRADLAAIPGVKETAQLPAADGRGVAIVVTLDKENPKALVNPVSERLRQLASVAPGSVVELGGGRLVNREVNAQVQKDLNRAEFLSLPLTVLVMVFVFGGLVAAGVPLLATLATVAGAFAVLLGFSTFVDLDSNIISVVSMLGLALCIDYSLLLVARYREELAGGHEPAVAVERTWATAGRTIAFSALTIMGALAGLLCFAEAPLRAMGAAGMSATVVALLAAITLSAALISVFRRRIRPPSLAAQASRDGGFFARIARVVQRRPAMVATLTAVGLLALGAPLLDTTVKLNDMESLPRSLESVRVADTLAARYGQPQSPVTVTMVARTDASTLDSWAGTWNGDPAIVKVGKAAQLEPGLSRVTFEVAGKTEGDVAAGLVQRLRDNRPAAVDSWVTGGPAMRADLIDSLLAGLPYAAGVVVLAMFVLLFLMTGSVVVPVKALLMNVVSMAASFGVLVAVFDYGWLSGPLGTITTGGMDPFVMVLVFTFGFGLSMDYEVFLLARIKEQVDAGYSTEEAVQRGLQRSGRIITSAAALMLIVFGFFASAQVSDIEQLGLGLFVAVLIDATIVRCLLVPATMSLLGKANWWAPKPLRLVAARYRLAD